MASGRAKDPSHLSGPSVRDVRRSYVGEQYPTLLRNNRPRPSDLARMRQEISAFGYKPLVSILLPIKSRSRRSSSAAGSEGCWLGRALDCVLGQAYPFWELIVCHEDSLGQRARALLSSYERLDARIAVAHQGQEGAGMAALSNAALSIANGEFACVVGETDELSPEALFRMIEALQAAPEGMNLLYSDEDSIDEQGERSSPSFKPGWSPELLLTGDYVGRLALYRRELLEEVGDFREGFEGAEDLDLALRATEGTEGTEEIVHVPRVLYHRRVCVGSAASAEGGGDRLREGARRAISEALERRGRSGVVEDGLLLGTFRPRPGIRDEPKVSIIIPTRDNAHLLARCIESVERLTDYPNYEILIVDNDSVDPATLEYFASTSHRVIPFRGAFNYSSINNLAVSEVEGKYVLLLNDDVEVIEGGWLRAMLEHAQDAGVGAVGAKLLYPDGRIQHAGVVTGVGPLMAGVSTHAYQFYSSEDPGHMGTLARAANYSAVTAACMLLRKEVYEEVGGLDEKNLRVSFNDVDLCLRIRERGYRVVYTPYAELYHHESVSRGYKGDPAEVLYMRERWGKVLDEDPYYNAHFSRGSGDFNLRADLLRPRVLRQENPPEDPANTFKSSLTTGPEELRDFIWKRQQGVRDSNRTVILPKRGEKSVRIAAVENPERDESAGPRGNGRSREAPSPLADDRAVREPEARVCPGAHQLVWVFGSPRTGSTWLSKMMAELENQQRWNEPYVGLLFGSFLHERLGGAPKLLANPSFILSDAHKESWLGSVKDFVLAGARARYPELARDAYLVIKEPNGSVGASLLMEALPESHMVFLMRDPRDVVASRLDALREGGWTGQERDLGGEEKLAAFTRHLAEDYLSSVSQVREAYGAHPARKAFVRYEDLRADAFGTMKAMYAELGIPFDEARLEAAVAKHSWEAIPEENKGGGKFHRKASPGGWREDLSPEQAAIVEEVTGPIISEYYRH